MYLQPGEWNLFGRDVALRVLETAVATWMTAGAALDLRLAGVLASGEEAPRTDHLAENPHIVAYARDDGRGIECRESGVATLTSSVEFKVFGGKTWLRLTDSGAAIEFNPADTMEHCPQSQVCQFVNIAAHEVGHALGQLRHLQSPSIMGTPDLCSCGRLTEHDAEALRERYPATRPPTIMTPVVLPPAMVGVPYAVRLDAIGGSGQLSWSPGLSLNPYGVLEPSRLPSWLSVGSDGMLTGTPDFLASEPPFVLAVTDDHGDSHTKIFQLLVHPYRSGGATTTTTTSTLPGPAPEVWSFGCVTTTTMMQYAPSSTFPPPSSTTTTLPPAPCPGNDHCAAARCIVTEPLDAVLGALPPDTRSVRNAIRKLQRAAVRAVTLVERAEPDRLPRAVRRSVQRSIARTHGLMSLVEKRNVRRRLGDELKEETRLLAATLQERISRCSVRTP